MEEAQFKSVIECTRNAKDLPMHISPPTLRDIGGLRAEARSVKKRMEARGTPLRLIVFDYIQRMQHQGEKIDVLNAASAMVKDLAVQFGVPVITLSQLNRDVEARAGQGKGSIPKPRLSDLKGSGAIEEDADMVIFVHRDEYYLDQIKNKSADWQEMKERAAGKMDLIIGKFRNGQRIDVTVDVNMPCNIILRPRRAASSDQQDFGL
jgi:replicative DNA helicase